MTIKEGGRNGPADLHLQLQEHPVRASPAGPTFLCPEAGTRTRYTGGLKRAQKPRPLGLGAI